MDKFLCKSRPTHSPTSQAFAPPVHTTYVPPPAAHPTNLSLTPDRLPTPYPSRQRAASPSPCSKPQRATVVASGLRISLPSNLPPPLRLLDASIFFYFYMIWSFLISSWDPDEFMWWFFLVGSDFSTHGIYFLCVHKVYLLIKFRSVHAFALVV